MALLAEPRRRQKYSIDPRGLNWSKDEDKFGHKMLEKMGWTKGKGLGANENGNPDHITVKHKADTRGVGCTKNHADNWLAHQDDFNSLLSALSADHPPDTSDDAQAASAPVQSLEEKSKQQKSRLHYKKFTKSKDLSRYGNTDLDSIFGKRKSVSAPVTPQVQSEANSDTEEQKEDADSSPEESKDKSGSLFGVTTITNTTSITDYFAQKMAALKESRMKKDSSGGPNVLMEDGNMPAAEEVFTGSVDCSAEPVKKKKKSKKSKDVICTEMGSQDSMEVEIELEVSKKSKKSKIRKPSKDEENASTSTEMVSQDTMDVETQLEYRKKSKKSKKNKQCQDEENLSTEMRSRDSTDVETQLEVSKKSKESKKRKREETGCCNASSLPGGDTTNRMDNCKKDKKKSKRKNETKYSGVDLEESQTVHLCDDQPAEIKKAERSKKRKCEKTGNCTVLESITHDMKEVHQINAGENESTEKSKKKRQLCNEGSSDCASVVSQSSRKKQRKSENMNASVISAESVLPHGKADQASSNPNGSQEVEIGVKQNTTQNSQRATRKKKSKRQNEKKRKTALETLEKSGKGLGFVGSNLDDIGGYGGGFVVKYPWADKKY